MFHLPRNRCRHHQREYSGQPDTCSIRGDNRSRTLAQLTKTLQK